MSSKKRLVICMFTLLILATLMPLSAAAEQPILKGPIQVEINSKIYIQQGPSTTGPWITIDIEEDTIEFKPPTGYYYEQYKTVTTYSTAKEIYCGCWQRTKTVKYKYRLVPL